MSGEIVTGRHGRSRAQEEVPQEYAAFKIEQRGIDLIPDAERKMRPSGLFWLWAGAVFNVEFLFYGTLIMTFDLSVPQAVAEHHRHPVPDPLLRIAVPAPLPGTPGSSGNHPGHRHHSEPELSGSGPDMAPGTTMKLSAERTSSDIRSYQASFPRHALHAPAVP